MLRRIVIALIRGYQAAISPLLGPCCRFTPSCSRYACECIAHHGVLRGGWLTMRRLLRCHPWHPGGIDLPPSPPSSHSGTSPALAAGGCAVHPSEHC